MHFDKELLKSALADVEILGTCNLDEVNFSIDSRSILKDELFVALSGSKFDGHDFLSEALKNGALGLMIKKSEKDRLSDIDTALLKSKLILIVENPLDALISLAAFWREKFSCPVVAITGSVGKTTTKQVVKNICEEGNKNIFVSHGNQNTLLGVSINILKMKQDLDAAVFEVGISKRGEMANIANLLKPSIGVITGIGHSHMEGLGTLYDISSEKRNVFKAFKESNIGIINGDSQYLTNVGYSHPVIKFGTKTTNQIQARKIKINEDGIDLVLKIYNKKFNVHLNTLHEGLVYNCMAAAAVAYVLNIPNEVIISGISKQLKIKGRFESKEILNGGGIVIDDCYNASPESVKSALVAFDKLITQYKKVIVLSDMNELGKDSAFWHRQIGRFLRKVDTVSHVILVGKMVHTMANSVPLGIKLDCYQDYNDALELINQLMKDQKLCILVKGSTHGYKTGLVNIVKSLTEGVGLTVQTKNAESAARV